MAIGFTIHYHPKVVRDDIPLLSATWKERIRNTIEEKLIVAPEKFGKPLRQSLTGCRKLRVSDYRIVFRIEGNSVFILAVLHRSVVYKNTATRSSRR